MFKIKKMTKVAIYHLMGNYFPFPQVCGTDIGGASWASGTDLGSIFEVNSSKLSFRTGNYNSIDNNGNPIIDPYEDRTAGTGKGMLQNNHEYYFSEGLPDLDFNMVFCLSDVYTKLTWSTVPNDPNVFFMYMGGVDGYWTEQTLTNLQYPYTIYVAFPFKNYPCYKYNPNTGLQESYYPTTSEVRAGIASLSSTPAVIAGQSASPDLLKYISF